MNTQHPPGDAAGERLDSIIIGAGQAGLALGWHLSRQGRNFVILDAHHRVGDSWRLRWDSLRLFTPAKYDGLPGAVFPGDRLGFPGKDALADFLESYAARFELPVRNGVHVERLSSTDGGYLVEAGDRQWQAATVVIATGGCQLPRVPPYADQISPEVVQLHSSGHRNPTQLRPGNVLVVGAGNSGAEIALELSRTHQTLLAGRPSGQLPVRHGRTAARFVLPVVRFAGLHLLNLDRPLGRKVAPKFRASGAPLIRTKVDDLVGAGVQQTPRVVGVRNGAPVLDGGQTLQVSNIVWCTGYFEDFSWVDLPVRNGAGELMHRRGVIDAAPGLYVIGLEFLYSATSATLPGVGRDAEYLAGRITARLAGTTEPAGTGTAVPADHRSS